MKNIAIRHLRLALIGMTRLAPILARIIPGYEISSLSIDIRRALLAYCYMNLFIAKKPGEAAA